MRQTTSTVFFPFLVTVRRSCATWAAPANPIQAGARTALIVRRDLRPWPVLTEETAGIRAQGSFLSCRYNVVAVFVATETRARQPITPMRLFADVSRAGSFIARLLLIAGMFGMFYFITEFHQKIMGFSPLRAGVAFLPMTVALFAVSRLAPKLMPRMGAPAGGRVAG